MSSPSAGSNNGSNDTQVSGYEREINRQKAAEKAKKQAEANVEMGLGKSSTNVTDGTLSDPREKDDTGVKQSIKDSKKTTFTPDNSGEGYGAENVLKGNAVPGGVGGPTKAEVSQSEAANADADADTEANRLLKIKKKGRSRSIMTSAKGVTKTSSDYSLGKPSLLGRV
jgi:hypothetical protein